MALIGFGQADVELTVVRSTLWAGLLAPLHRKLLMLWGRFGV